MNRQVYKTGAAVAKSGAMEADTISKHGRNSKSQMSRRNKFNSLGKIVFKYLTFTSFAFSIMFLNSCSTCNNVIKGDVIGFHDKVNPASFNQRIGIIPFMRASGGAPINLSSNRDIMTQQISNLDQGMNTSAYKALELGLNRTKYVKKFHMGFRCFNSKYYLITFTDGKDNISATTEQSYARYDNKLNRKMKRTMGLFNRKNSFQSWTLLLVGDDLKKDGYTDSQLRDMLTPYTWDSQERQNMPKQVLMDENINTLFETFKKEFTRQGFSFYIPKGYSGKKVNMILKDDANNEVSFEGDFKSKGLIFKRYSLQNIKTSENFKFEMGNNNSIKMDFTTRLNSNRINFTIRGVQKDGKSFIPVPDSKHITQQYMDKGAYRFNSEYIPDTNQLTDAYVLSIIDCSLSMGDQMEIAKKLMIDVVNNTIVPDKNK